MVVSTSIGIEEVIETHAIRAVYQPIVDVDTSRTVGFEALARGPVGSELESPDRLFAAAAAAGVTSELDWECRAAALRGALENGLDRRTLLFVNAEPATFRTPRPPHLDELLEEAADRLNVVIEFTERGLADDPAGLVQGLIDASSLGFAVALDDVGADPASLAFMPILAPEVIKLDMALVHDVADRTVAAISAAVRSDAELNGSVLLAEGIENNTHLERAVVLGASLGQGWMYGRPSPLAVPSHRARGELGLGRRSRRVAATPWELVGRSDRRRIATKELLMPMSRHLEEQPYRSEDRPVVLGAFQDARHFTANTSKRYLALTARTSFVGALGIGMDPTPAAGVRGASLSVGHPLAGEWAVVVIGPHFSGALLARDLGDAGPDRDRRFEYVVTHDRQTVADAARSLMQHLSPI